MSISNALRRPRAAALAVLAALVLAGVGPLANPTPVAAGAAADIEAKILELINEARADRDVAPLQTTVKLVNFAGDRAAKMADTGKLKHPKCLPCKLNNRNIPYNGWGETIAWTYGPWAASSGESIFNIWKNSPPHWAILMSPNYDRIGIGVARRANGSIWAAAVLTG